MAVLKAFVCQVILLGLYKLFLEQVVEDYLLPDELTRNCLVGFVCLVCFGIQLYTDKAEDEDNAEADENPKAKSESRGSAKKSESAEISAIHETVGSSTSSRITATKPQTTSQEIATEKKVSTNNKQVGDSEERSNAISPIEAENVTEVGHSSIFAKFSTCTPDTIPNVKANGMGEAKVPASTAETSYDQETTNIPVLNGFSEINVCEESDDDSIEIDQFVAKDSDKDEVEQLRTVKAEEVEPIKAEDVTEEVKQLKTVEVFKSEDVPEEAKQLRIVEAEEVEAMKTEDVTETVVESECLTNGEDISSTQDSDKITILKTGESSEAQMTNSIAEESLSNIDNISSNIIEEIEGKKSGKDEGEIGNEQEIISSSKPDEYTRDITKSLPSAQEMSSTCSTSTKAVNDIETMNKNNAEISTLVKTEVPSPSEKLTVSTARPKVTTAGDVCIAPVTIDISFIYACH